MRKSSPRTSRPVPSSEPPIFSIGREIFCLVRDSGMKAKSQALFNTSRLRPPILSNLHKPFLDHLAPPPGSRPTEPLYAMLSRSSFPSIMKTQNIEKQH